MLCLLLCQHSFSVNRGKISITKNCADTAINAHTAFPHHCFLLEHQEHHSLTHSLTETAFILKRHHTISLDALLNGTARILLGNRVVQVLNIKGKHNMPVQSVKQLNKVPDSKPVIDGKLVEVKLQESCHFASP